MKKYSVCIIILLCFSIHLTSQNLSVKGRWNIKASYSRYKEFNEDYGAFPHIEGSKILTEERFAKQSNPRIELNYGVLNWLETGIYAGFMMYRYDTSFDSGNYWFNPDEDLKYAYAPTFGVNINFHILPFFVKNQKCKWDFYVPVRYGGCYLTKWLDGKYGVIMEELGTWDDVDGEPSNNRYRHEYGAGLGVAVYIKNIMGFYTEVLGGQFSYWPELVRSPYSIRVGLTAKF